MTTASVGFEQRKLSFIKIFTSHRLVSNHEIFSDEIIDKLLDKVMMHDDNFFCRESSVGYFYLPI